MLPRFKDAPYGKDFDVVPVNASFFQKSKANSKKAQLYMDWVMCCVYVHIPSRTSGEVVVPDKDRNKFTVNMKRISMMAMACSAAYSFLDYIQFLIPPGIFHKIEHSLFYEFEDPTKIFSKEYRDKAEEFKLWYECFRREIMTEIMMLHLDWGTMGRNNYAFFLEKCFDDVFDKRGNKANIEISNANTVISPTSKISIEFVEVSTPEEVKAIEDYNAKNHNSPK